MKRLLSLALAGCLPLVLQAQQPKIEFAAPVRLLSEGKPLNQREKLLFPSPVLMEIDGSKQTKLVVGDLWGKLRVYEPLGSKGNLTWGKGTNLKTLSGKELVIPNW